MAAIKVFSFQLNDGRWVAEAFEEPSETRPMGDWLARSIGRDQIATIGEAAKNAGIALEIKSGKLAP